MKKKSKPLGRFVPCPASFAAHDGWVFCETHLSPTGSLFVFCSRCRFRGFLNTWEESWGWTLAQVEREWGGVVDIPPPRRMELERAERDKPSVQPPAVVLQLPGGSNMMYGGVPGE